MNTVVIQQPNYLPWLGYFELLASADNFVFLDNVQWIKQGRQHRTSIAAHKSQKELQQWLSLPVHSQGHRKSAFSELKIAEKNWSEIHWRTIQAVYGSAPYFREQISAWLPNWFAENAEEENVARIAANSALAVLELLDLPRPHISYASDLAIESTNASDRIRDICIQMEANIYYSAMGGVSYLNLADFRDSGVRIVQQNFRIANYRAFPQATMPLFSVLDALAYCHKSEIRSWLLPKEWGLFAHRLGVENNFRNSP